MSIDMIWIVLILDTLLRLIFNLIFSFSFFFLHQRMCVVLVSIDPKTMELSMNIFSIFVILYVASAIEPRSSIRLLPTVVQLTYTGL